MIQNRKSQIQEINNRLEEIKKTASPSQLYAIEQNLIFFRAAQSFIHYFGWLFTVAKKIEGRKLLELSDFGVPAWEKELQNRLINMERKSFPGMITPLKKTIVEFILKNEPKILADLGSGGMEVERQIIIELKKRNYQNKLIFLGIDQSPIVHEIAKENLQGIKGISDIIEIDQISPATMTDLQKKSTAQYLIFLSSNDIFKLTNQFPKQSINLIYYSKFRHHLNEDQKNELDKITTTLAKTVMEYDDYRSWFLMIPQSIATWKYPVLMNGAIFSRLRDLTKKELRRSMKDNWKIHFYLVGSYLKTYK